MKNRQVPPLNTSQAGESSEPYTDYSEEAEPPKYRLIIDARESGTSTGRYVDKLIEHLAQLKPDMEIKILTKSARLNTLKQLAPNFKITASDFKEFTFAEQLGLKKQVRSLKADLVHFTTAQQPVLYGGKKLTTIHDLTTIRFSNPSKNRLVFKFKQLVYRAVIKRVARTSDRIITPSQYVKDDLVKFSNVRPDKVQVVYEAADKITAPAKPIGGLVGSSFLMYVGRPTPHKNLSRLVEAFEKLQQKYPALKLVLAGKSDANYARLQKFTSKKNLTLEAKSLTNQGFATGQASQARPRSEPGRNSLQSDYGAPSSGGGVIFTGFVDEGQLRWLYENCQAYVFPSLSEGFGLPGLEAMAHGAPVISSNATCLPEIYGSGAIYFDPENTDDMAVKINRVLEDSKLRQNLINKGYAQVQKYSWANTAKQTLKIYQELLED